MGSYEGKKGNPFLKEKCILELVRPVELFVMVSISNLITVNYWKNFGKTMINIK